MPVHPLPPSFLDRPFAHRGLHDRSRGVVENSRAAIVAAIEGGYGVEMDIQMSSDGEAMVFHDYQLTRLTGREGFARTHTAQELSLIRLTDSDEAVPTLAEVLDLVAGRTPLLIEIKDQHLALGPVDGRVEARVADLLSGYRGEVALMSFNPHSVARCGTFAPDVPRGRVTCDFGVEDWAHVPADRRAELALLNDLETLGASFISHQHDRLADAPVARVKAAGLPVTTWTIRSPEEEAMARRVADNITFEGYRA